MSFFRPGGSSVPVSQSTGPRAIFGLSVREGQLTWKVPCRRSVVAGVLASFLVPFLMRKSDEPLLSIFSSVLDWKCGAGGSGVAPAGNRLKKVANGDQCGVTPSERKVRWSILVSYLSYPEARWNTTSLMKR